MKKIFFIIFLLIVTSGCKVSEEKVQKQLDRRAQESFTDITPHIEYNFEDFAYEGNECWYRPFLCTQGRQMYIWYEPEEGFKKLFVDANLFFGEDASTILDVYYTDYVFNEFIFDETKGNRLDEMFIYLENQEIDYYISSQLVDGMQSQETLDREYFHYLTRETSFNQVFSSAIDVKTTENIPTDEEYIEYITNKNMDTMDFYEYMKFCSYYPFIKIYLDQNNITQEELEILIPTLREFYDEDTLNIVFEIIDSSSNRTRSVVDKVRSYDISLDSDYIPVYDWNE